MSQEIRRRLAARAELQPAPHSEAEVPAPLRIRRFSEGLECAVIDKLRVPHLGRFSQGAERLAEDAPGKTHIGRYSDGLGHEPANAPSQLHVGRFSQGTDHSNY
ncbi:MAG: hypothetical protein ACXVUL_12735 [Solirubrobacteraceae bacterium]